jgi:hypothetical protein
VKANYAAIVIDLESIYEQTHEPEALGIGNALSRTFTVIAIFLLDFVLPQVARLSKCLQAEKLDLAAISSLVNSTLQTLDDALLPAAIWVFDLVDAREEIEAATKIKVPMDAITSFQENTTRSFLKRNFSRWFSSQDIVSSFSICDPFWENPP